MIIRPYLHRRNKTTFHTNRATRETPIAAFPDSLPWGGDPEGGGIPRPYSQDEFLFHARLYGRLARSYGALAARRSRRASPTCQMFPAPRVTTTSPGCTRWSRASVMPSSVSQ